jgi:hypothetical protein
MIQITNQEYIKSKDDFKLDGLHVKKFQFDFPTSGSLKQSLVVELVPYTVMDDGSRLHDQNKIYKIYIPDLETYIQEHGLTTTASAYFATEQGINEIMNIKFPLLQTIFVPPQQG